MKKKLVLFLIVTLLLSSSTTFLVSAQPAPGGPFTSSLRLQNMGTEPAIVYVDFYDSDGVIAYTTPHQTIEPGDAISILLPDGTLTSGQYSAVVSSDQPLASLSTFMDDDSGAAYTGFSQGSQEWFIPGLYDDYYKYFSNVYVQNVTDTPVDITLEIFAPGKSTPVYTNTKTNVQPYASVQWKQNGLAELKTNVFYAGKITATGDVVAIANVHGTGSIGPQLLSYNGYESGTTKWYTPVLVNNYYGWNASLIIQNVTGTAADVTVKYSTGYTQTLRISPYSVASIYIPHQSLPSGKNGLFGAQITSNQDIVVMVNQGNDTNNSAATYNGFAGGSTKVFAPGVMKRSSLFSTSITCQNLGTSATRMQVEYYGQPGAGSTSPNIGVGKTYLWYQPNESLPNGYIGSAVVTSLDGQNIACIVNRNTEDEPYFSMNWDMFFSANGINQ